METSIEKVCLIILTLSVFAFLLVLDHTLEISSEKYLELKSFYSFEPCRSVIASHFEDGQITLSEFSEIESCVDEQPKRDFQSFVSEVN